MSDRIETLRTLHTRLIDSCDGYRTAIEKVEGTPAYATHLETLLAERKSFHARLHEKLATEGVEVDESGSLAAGAHRGWLALRDALTGGDGAVYDEIVTGESHLKEAYEDAIAATAGQPGWSFLTEQRAAVERAVSEARTEKAHHAA